MINLYAKNHKITHCIFLFIIIFITYCLFHTFYCEHFRNCHPMFYYIQIRLIVSLSQSIVFEGSDLCLLRAQPSCTKKDVEINSQVTYQNENSNFCCAFKYLECLQSYSYLIYCNNFRL